MGFYLLPENISEPQEKGHCEVQRCLGWDEDLVALEIPESPSELGVARSEEAIPLLGRVSITPWNLRARIPNLSLLAGDFAQVTHSLSLSFPICQMERIISLLKSVVSWRIPAWETVRAAPGYSEPCIGMDYC